MTTLMSGVGGRFYLDSPAWTLLPHGVPVRMLQPRLEHRFGAHNALLCGLKNGSMTRQHNRDILINNVTCLRATDLRAAKILLPHTLNIYVLHVALFSVNSVP
jgi:hypothetical protein